MADLTSQSPNPLVRFVHDSGGPTLNWWQWYGSTSTSLQLQQWGTAWTSLFDLKSTGLDLLMNDPKIALVDTSGNTYSLDSDGTRLAIKEGSTNLVLTNSTEVNSKVPITIDNGNPKLTFHDTSGATSDYVMDVNADLLLFKHGGSTIAELSNDFLIGTNGVGAGGNNPTNHVLRWKKFTGTLGAAGPATTTVVVTLGGARKLFGALVAITPSTSEQGDTTWGVYDYIDASSATNGFTVTIDRFAANDRVNIAYKSGYAAGSLYKIIAFYEP